MRDKLKVMPFPSRRDALQDGLKWRKRVKYIKCFCQHFLLFNRKKDQNKRFEGGGSGNRALGSWHQQWRWRRWNDDEEEERCGGIYLKKKKVFKWKKQNKNNKWSQPRMRLDLPPGGFLRPPALALAFPDGAGCCGFSFCCSCSSCSTSSEDSGAATKENAHLFRANRWSRVTPDVWRSWSSESQCAETAVWQPPCVSTDWPPPQNFEYLVGKY